MKRMNARSLLVLAALSGAPLLASSAAEAQPQAATSAKNLEEAKSRYQKGLQLYDDGAFDAARVQFERANELAPSYRILYNIGLVYKQLNEFVGSLNALQRYLQEGGPEVPEDRKAEVNKLIESLKGIIASANVEVNVPNAEISVDDKAVGKSPLSAPVLLNPGRRKISAKLEGRLPDAKVIEVASGDKASVVLKLEQPKQQIINKGTDLAPIISWSVTGALAIGAAVTGYLTTRADKDLDDEKNNPKATAGSLDDASSQLKTGALVTDILMAATVVGVGVSAYLTWFRGDNKEKAPPKKEEKKETTKGPSDVRVGLGAGGLLIRGSF